MSKCQDKAFNILFRCVTPGIGDPADDLIARLVEIRDAKSDLLTAEEYQAFRNMVLNQIVDRVRMPLYMQVILALGCIGSTLLIVYGIVKQSSGAIFGGGAGLCTSVLLWFGLGRDYMARRSLSRETRLKILDRLVEESILTEEESQQLRNRIIGRRFR